MALNTRISAACAIAACNAEVDLVDTGAGTAKLRWYTGTQPASPDDAITSQTLVAEFDLPNPAFGNAATGAGDYAEAALNSTPIEDSSANNSGTVTWYRIINRNGDAVIDGSCGTSSANCIIDNPVINSGQVCRLTSVVHRVPWHA